MHKDEQNFTEDIQMVNKAEEKCPTTWSNKTIGNAKMLHAKRWTQYLENSKCSASAAVLVQVALTKPRRLSGLRVT